MRIEIGPQVFQEAEALTDLLVTPAQEIPRIRCGGQMKGAAVHARTFNGVSIGSSVDGQNTLIGDGRGSLVHMRAGNGASPAEVSNLAMANGFTSLVTEDALAYDAARQSAIDSKTWPTSQARFKQAAQGSVDYLSGRTGNAYTQYLKERFGGWLG